MQPFLFISCDIEGLLYVNGRLVGMTKGDGECIPVAPTGAVYIEHKPAKPGFLPLARAIALSRGNIVEGSVSPERGLGVVRWPGGVLEISLEPEPSAGYESADFSEGIPLNDSARQTLTPLDDIAGHLLVETYALSDGRWEKAKSEVMWTPDGPRWPQTPEDTAIAACQASVLGLSGEARGYVAPGRPQVERDISALYGRYDGCARAAYCPSGDAVALVKVLADNLAQVDYARYSCQKSGGRQGDWRLESFEIAP